MHRSVWSRALAVIGSVCRAAAAANSHSASALRGGASSDHAVLPVAEPKGSTAFARSLAQPESTVLAVPLTFQICISAVLGIIVLVQLYLTCTLFLQRKKRVFQFAQSQALCVFLAAAVAATAGCYLFVYTSDAGCAIRDPVIFVSISTMGATVASRAWRISSLMNNPLMAMGSNGGEGKEEMSRVERVRLALLRVLTVLSGCTLKSVTNLRRDSTGTRPGLELRNEVSEGKMMLMTAMLVAPQLLWQVLTLAVPRLRPREEYVEVAHEIFGVDASAGRYECVSPAPGSWPFWIGVVFAALPLGCAYLLNVRPKRELDQLPEAVDERSELQASFRIFLQILLVAGPIYFMALTPNVKAYAGIAMVLGLTLSLCYHIVYLKLRSMEVAPTQRGSVNFSGATDHSSSSSAYASKMVDMYERIGQDEKCVAVIDETLSMFIKSKTNALGMGLSKAKEEIGAGFTKKDLENISADELKLIIQLLHKKGQALIRLQGYAAGQKLCAKMNVDSIAIYENCPAAQDLDPSIIFPVYSMCGAQLKGGQMQQDDVRSLERDLADRFSHEAHVHAYHLARALVQQADIRAGMGLYDEAFSIFEKMRLIYLPDVHPKLLTKIYAQDRCAQCFAYSALWYMQQGKIEKAIERCELVIKDILPTEKMSYFCN